MAGKMALAVASATALVVGTVLAATGEPSPFVGATRCGDCHKAAYQAWKDSAHSKSNAALPADMRADARCVRCHGSTDAGTGGVQCESCHGEGKYYARRHVMKDHVLSRIVGLTDVSQKTCVRCHTIDSPTVRPFSWERAWPVITHGMDAAPAKVAGGK